MVGGYKLTNLLTIFKIGSCSHSATPFSQQVLLVELSMQ